MTMIDELMEVIDEIETASDRDYEFITRIAEQKEIQPNKKLTGPQFKWLIDCHNRYVRGNKR